MSALLDRIRNIRASNLVFMAVAPFLIFFILTSRNYGPALKAVLGVEDNALLLLGCFVVSGAIGVAATAASIILSEAVRPDVSRAEFTRLRNKASILLVVKIVLLAFALNIPGFDYYIGTIAINANDARTTDWIIIVGQSFDIKEGVLAGIVATVEMWAYVWLAFSVAALALSRLPRERLAATPGRAVTIVYGLIGFAVAFYVIMVAYAGFAVGLMVTLRAAVFAYLGASFLGMIWAMLTRLKPSRRASIIQSGVGVVLLLVSAWSFAQPKIEVALVGALDGRIGIVAGTPQGVTDTIRYGEFQETPPDAPYKIRSLATEEQALDLLAGGHISAAVLSPGAAPDLPVIWATSFLPVTVKTTGIATAVIGGLLLLLVGIGKLTGAHPMHVFSEFFVDTIRGVPMLVIILYIGLPLAGAVKAASSGYIDMATMTRGVLAIAVGYSAYMAEIFRAGIDAVPKGQIEAARTLGLSNWLIARFIVLPQAIAIVLPALGNEFIAMLKDTSLLSILSVRDITQRMREFQAQSFLAFEPFNSAAILYVVLTLIAASGIKAIDNVINKNRIR
jgi:polar amino acid transport system permease protein